jgi:hypothetical protein
VPEDPPPESRNERGGSDEESAFPKPLPPIPGASQDPAISLPPIPAFGEQPQPVNPVWLSSGSGETGPGQDEPGTFASGGSMKSQDAATTRPRPATPAELRAREKYEKKQREIEEARLAAEEKRKKRNRRLIGAGAGIGVVGVVAGLGYWALSAPTVYAQCVRDDPNGQPVIVPDSYCSGHTSGLNGFFYYGGHQYRYYYGSSGGIGARPFGGTTTRPSGPTIKTHSGTTIQRGGLGGKFGGSRGGGS